MTEFANLQLDKIVASTTNPRKTFHQERLAELAESIKASGVHTPVLVRPLPASRVQDTADMTPRPTFELVTGERRFRASQMAGKDSIPAMVRALTDDQVLEIQIIENLQRDDLLPLEEAEGYEHLMQRHEPRLTADEVASRIGKSRSYVYSRLKLLDLGPEGREALRTGKIDASRALLIARIPDTKLQRDALGNLFDWQGEALSYREAADMLQNQYMLRLAEARFKITDETLVPDAGSCRTCSKRTGANPDLFADVKGADVCTDPPCFKAKEAAHQERQLKAARESGATIIEGREAKALVPHSWNTRIDGYLRLDAKGQALYDWIKDHADPDRALALLMMFEDVEWQSWKPETDQRNPTLIALATDIGVAIDIDAVKKEVKAEHAAAIKARKKAQEAKAAESQEGSSPLSSAAHADGVRGEQSKKGSGKGGAKGAGKGGKGNTAPAAPAAARLSEDEARTGIAAAMQGDGVGADDGPEGADPAVGDAAGGIEGRATSPDAGASDTEPSKSHIHPGCKVEVNDPDSIFHQAVGIVQHSKPDTGDGPKVWVVDMAPDDDVMVNLVEFAEQRLVAIVDNIAWPFPGVAA